MFSFPLISQELVQNTSLNYPQNSINFISSSVKCSVVDGPGLAPSLFQQNSLDKLKQNIWFASPLKKDIRPGALHLQPTWRGTDMVMADLWSLHPSKTPLAFVYLTMDCCLWQVSVVRFWNLFWLLLLIQDAITYPHRDRCMFKCKLIWTQHRNYRHNWSEVYITWKLKSWKISAFFLSFLFYFIFLIFFFLLFGS